MLPVRPQTRQNLSHERASAFIRALFSVFSSEARNRRCLLMLQVCIDDSRTEPNQGPVFILAGFMAKVKHWERFADEWDAHSRAKPRIEFLKGKQAFERSGQFKGWTCDQRDKKVLGFVSLIKKYRLKGVLCLINHEQFATHPGSLQFLGNPILKEPAYTAVAAVTCAVLGWILKSKTFEKVSFIYDEKVVSRKELESGHRSMRERVPKRAVDLVAHEPKFEDDKEFLPLQAADLFAYYFGRNTYLIARGRHLESPIWDALSDIPLINASLYEDDLQSMTGDAIAAIKKRFAV